MKVRPTALPEVLLIEPRLFGDERGHFLETYHAQRYSGSSISATFVQDNLSHSHRGVVRGLHYQWGRPQGKLIMVVQGEIFDVAVDIRQGSPTFGRWVGVTLSARDYQQLYIPEGFAHGFCATSDSATVCYKCTDFYVPQDDRGIRWDDPTLAISWPITEAILSDKDRSLPSLAEIPAECLPVFGGTS
jgi:dTDP-4-dehydrorhamnose 3,5-epimerase